jgi:YHS domain-containing protein/thiol-disulfide isomerase/thioredoxin
VRGIYSAVIAIGLGLGVMLSNAMSAPLSWRQDLRAAAAEAAGSGKPMLVKVGTSWCGYCRKMSRETFSEPTVVDHISNCFVPVHLDGDAHRRLVKSLGVKSYPTTIILSPDMKVVSKITGFRTAKQLNDELSGLCGHAGATASAQLASKASVFAGLCPVSPVLDGKLVNGDPRLRLSYHGFDLAFASAAHREAFRKSPERYWPSIDGYCAVSAVDEAKLQPGELELALLYQGRIWLFASQLHMERFRERPDHYLGRLRELSEQRQDVARR